MFAAEIHAQEPEFFRIAKLPLEIVQQRPVIKAAQVHATLHGAMQSGQVLSQITPTKCLVR